MAHEPRPYSRQDFHRALIGNALLDPFAIVLLAVMAIAGILLSAVGILLPVGLVLYGAAAARSYFDEDVANKVLERERAKRRSELEWGQKRTVRKLAPPIAGLLNEALQRERRIRDAVEGAQLPYTEVLDEVERFVRAMEGTAGRAQLLYEALADSDPAAVEGRLAELRRENDPGRQELVAALSGHLEVLRRMERQLQAFYDQMEKILVELDTVRGNLVSVSASTDAANQQQLAAEVRELREEVSTLAEGMSEAYEEPGPAPA
jgi:chromosome segregation ATPase